MISFLYALNAPGRVYSACRASRLAHTQPAGASWAGTCSRMPFICHSMWLKMCRADAFSVSADVPMHYFYMLPVEAVQTYGVRGKYGAICIDIVE